MQHPTAAVLPSQHIQTKACWVQGADLLGCLRALVRLLWAASADAASCSFVGCFWRSPCQCCNVIGRSGQLPRQCCKTVYANTVKDVFVLHCACCGALWCMWCVGQQVLAVYKCNWSTDAGSMMFAHVHSVVHLGGVVSECM